MTSHPDPLVKIKTYFTACVIMMPYAQNAQNGSAQMNKRAARALDKKCLKMTFYQQKGRQISR